MQDWRDEFEMDDQGQLRKKKRVARDRDRISFPMTAMDAAAGRFYTHFADGTPDHTSPHRPGHRFADTDDPNRLTAEEAYQERSRRMQDAWRRLTSQEQEAVDRRVAQRQRSLDELRTLADQAYADRSVRLANAWRQR